MFVFDSITFSNGKNLILRGVYLAISPSSIVGLFGLNGCGKSTLIKIGAGFLSQNDGNVFLNGKVLKKNSILERFNSLGYLSQDSFLPKDIIVYKLLEKIKLNNSNIIEDVLIKKILNQKIATLSGGELRYLEILHLFSLNRSYFLLDEPFTGIEPLFVERIIEKIQIQKENGKGILITDHYHHYLTEIIDKCYLLSDGNLKELEHSNNCREELLRNGYLTKQ